jgi:hypothetical protein
MMLQLLTWLETSRFSEWLVQSDTIWAYPTVLTLHTVGLAMLVGANAALDLRLLGFGKRMPVASLRTTFPIMWIGFWINAVSGAMLFAADATTKGMLTIFQIKLGLIALGVFNVWLIKRAVFGNARLLDAGPALAEDETPIPLSAKLLAATSLLIWIIAIFAGRYMAYA